MNKAWVVAAAAVLSAGPVLAQNRGGKPRDERSEPRKMVERVKPHDWTLTVTVNLRPETRRDIKTKMPEREVFDFTSAAVVFPVIQDTAGHQLRGTENDIEGKLRLNDKDVLERPTEILTDYPAGTRLAKWGMQGWKGEEVEIRLKIPVTSWQVEFDEAAAMKLKWPDSWGSAASALEPEYYIDKGFEGPYDMEPVKELIKKWTAGKDPKSLAPAQLAKFFAGEVVRHVQVSGNGLSTARTGELEGIALQGAPETAKTGRGSEFDMVCLLVAAYRQAGLPARCVTGYDTGSGGGDDDRFLAKKGRGSFRVWAEFALMEPGKGEPTWVPVDVVKIRKSSTRPPALDRPWPYFGAHKEMDGIIPFAFQFFPPTKGVVSHGSPAFYGWMVTPEPPKNVIQSLRFDAMTTPRRAEDREKEDKKKSPYDR